MVVHIGGGFDRRDEMLERLRQGPGSEAQREAAPTADGPSPSRWTLATIRATFDWLTSYTLPGVWKVLQAAKLGLRSSQVQLYSPDPDYVAKEAYLHTGLRHAARDPKRIVFLLLDEMGYYRWPHPAPQWAALAPHAAPRALGGDPSNRQQRLVGILNALSGQVNNLDNYIVGRKQLSQFYPQIDQLYPTAERIYVAQDNWSVHRHPDVLASLVGLPRIQLVWLSTYAPWLNPIEKLWRWLRQDVLKMHRLAHDWKLLRARVNAFLDQFANGSTDLLRYVGLLGDGKLAQVIRNA